MVQPLRLGMVGGGRGAFIGGVHRLCARMDGHYELVAGALSSDPQRARESGADLGLAPDRIYTSFAEMAAAEAKRSDGIEVVSIVTPNDSHHAIARAFLDCGIDVICDKPMTTTVEDALDLVQTVRRTGLVFGVTHNYTGYPMVRQVRELAADLSRFVPGRRLDDNVHMLLRFENGARGMLWGSQVAPGNENGLRLRVYGDKGGLEWSQEHPNQLRFAPVGQPPRVLSRGGPNLGPAASRATRIPSGHPEGYLEAFANLYRDLAEQIRARRTTRAPDRAALLAPTVEDGAHGVKFIHAAVESSAKNGAWVDLQLKLR